MKMADVKNENIIGKVVYKALGVVGLASNWKVAVYVVGVYAAAHGYSLL
jgi:hypothetical protein